MPSTVSTPSSYWATIIASTTTGTTMADFADRSLGIGYPGGATVLALCVAASLAAWYRTLGSVSVETVRSPRAEIFYWITITFSQTLGTALGDWIADAGAGYGGGAIVFGVALLVLFALYLWTDVSRVMLFWAAFILTRPLGATLGDLFAAPAHIDASMPPERRRLIVRCRRRYREGHMRRLLMGSSCVLGLLVCGPAEARDTKAWGDASSAGRDALVLAALGLPAIQGDWTGDLEAGGSIVAAFGVTEGLKAAFPERRPDGSDDKSFPSGHASVSFAAAASLQNRYGWKVGLPAQLVAAFVGLGRVEARKHHWYDVVAGAAIGESSGFLLTTKRNSTVRVLPWGDASGGGASLGMRF